MFIKMLYLLNSVGQIFMMQSFLGFNTGNYSLFGMAIARDILDGRDWQVTLVFPRVGYCLVPVRHMGSNNYVTGQCVLPVNMLNERIYVFLWFWIVLVCTINALSIPTWFLRMSYQKSRTCFIKKYLKLGEVLTNKDRHMVEKFKRQFLRHDGIFLLRMIALNAGELICSDVVCQLWQIFKTRYFYRDFMLTDEEQEAENRTRTRVNLSEGVVATGDKTAATPIPSAPVEGTDVKKLDYA
ncbi:hypothetical protein AHF37_08670 [Paragonimus kellicotti]|nr:hypothetical protein AHF37_08669 [Paragonimus kellicotti]KAF6772796.1 hypothetical protein AHF37_08670 [Paragonimus kellicotti]